MTDVRPQRSVGGGHRLLRVDPWGPLLAAAGLGVFLLHGFQGELARDGALYAYAGQRFADGVPPYLGVLNRSGPLAHAIPGVGVLGARALGADDLLGMRVLVMLICLGSVWLAYLLGRDTFGSRLAGLMTGTTLLTLAGFVDMATGGPRDKIVIVAFCLGAAWAMARRWWVAAGVAVALATLTWQPAFFPAGAAVALAALLLPTWRDRLVAVARFALGGLAVLVVTVLAFVSVGGVAEFYAGFVGVHAGGYTTQQGILSKGGAKLLNLGTGYGWAVWLLAAGTLGILGLGAARLRKLDRTAAGEVATVALAAAALVTMVWSLYAYQLWTDALVLTPYAAAGVGGLAHTAAAALPRAVARRAGAVVVAVLLVVAGVASWLGRSTAVEAQRALPQDMLAAAGSGATLQAVGTAEPLVFTGRRNPVRYINFGKGLDAYLDDTLPGGVDRLARDLARRRPSVVVLEEVRRPRWVTPVLRQHYVLVGGMSGTGYWYAHTRLATSRVAEMRAVLRRADVPVAPAP